MTAADLRELFAYDDWATERLLVVAAGLTPQQFTTPAEGGASSVQSVLSHIVAEDWLWLRRCQGEDPDEVPAWAAQPSPQTLSRAFAEIRTERLAFLADINDTVLDRPLTFRSLEGDVHRHRVGDMLFHIVSHSAYHRGQAAILLRRVGATPVETDFVVFRESA
jgi:uncharacterized damage-inducible protein DinB